MNITVSIDEHYVRTPDGNIFSTEGTTSYLYWRQYLENFSTVTVVARVRDGQPASNAIVPANGPSVQFLALPDFQGAGQYLRMRSQVNPILARACRAGDAFLLRGPGLIGYLLRTELRGLNLPYAVQLIGDPWEAFGVGGAGGALRRAYQVYFAHELKKACKGAVAVSYVTKAALQKKYPASRSAIVGVWSDVQLSGKLIDAECLAARLAKLATEPNGARRIGFLGSLQQPYKGAHVLLEALALCAQRGLKFKACIAGEGKYRAGLEELAASLELSDKVSFPGRIPGGDSVFAFLDALDLFVMPSLTEGLPRALAEAMARGCPCVASSVGGIPELLTETDLVKPGNAEQLAAKITEKLSNPDELCRMAQRNRKTVEEYEPERAHAARFTFYEQLRRRLVDLRRTREKLAFAAEHDSSIVQGNADEMRNCN